MTRTFIALEMNTDLQCHLAGVIRQVAQALPGIRWVDPASIHLTLAFLGELDDARLASAIEAVQQAALQVPVFSYHLSRLGAFGSPRQPRIVWMGIDEPSGRLIRLHRALNRELRQRRFEVDTRPFSPHLTLARIKSSLASDELQHLQALLAGKQQGLISSVAYPAAQLAVMKSQLFRTGAQYTCLEQYKLREQVNK